MTKHREKLLSHKNIHAFALHITTLATEATRIPNKEIRFKFAIVSIHDEVVNR